MNLRDLQYVVTVADLGNFSQAAEQCHVSQPTLSAQVKKMEEYLDVTIFERTNKRVMVTQTGEAIVQAGRRILQEVDVIKDISKLAQDPMAGTFRIGAFPTLASYYFPQVVGDMRNHFPKLKLILIEEKTDTLIEQLVAGDIDAALLALPIHHDFLETAALFDDDFYLAVPTGHELASAKKVDQRVLSDNELLLLDEGHCLRDQALDVCQINGANEQENVRATSLETLRHMVAAGTGITLMPKLAISDHEPAIRYIPFREPAPGRTIGLVWRKTSPRKELLGQLITLWNDIQEDS